MFPSIPKGADNTGSFEQDAVEIICLPKKKSCKCFSLLPIRRQIQFLVITAVPPFSELFQWVQHTSLLISAEKLKMKGTVELENIIITVKVTRNWICTKL